jgi:hypothetical protein
MKSEMTDTELLDEWVRRQGVRFWRVMETLKPYLVVLNRLLAWSLVAAPAYQILFEVSWKKSLLVDFALMMLHGLLSMLLFRKSVALAESSRKSDVPGRGLNRRSLGERDRFMLDAWRVWFVGLVVAWIMLLAVLIMNVEKLRAMLGIFTLTGGMFLLLLLALALALALAVLAVSMVSLSLLHMRHASRYAYLRWQISSSQATALGWLTVTVFAILFTINLIKDRHEWISVFFR